MDQNFRQVTLTDSNSVSITLSFPFAMTNTQGRSLIKGGKLLRMEDGTGLLQTRWIKKKYTFGGQGKYPAGLTALNIARPMTVAAVLQHPSGSSFTLEAVSFTGLVTDINENFEWGLGGNNAGWAITLEEG